MREGGCCFSYRGIDCEEMGLRLLSLPKRAVSAQTGQRMRVPGGEGELFLPDGGRGSVHIALVCEAEHSRVPLIAQWLCGEGLLVFSDRASRAYFARVAGEISVEPVLAGFGRRRICVELVCEPYLYHIPAAEDIVLAGARTIVNPGNAPARPRIAVRGVGSGTLFVGEQAVEVVSISGGVSIDSEWRECLAADGQTLCNDRVRMEEFPCLLPGENAIRWTGGITGITITPNWRDSQ